VFIAPTIRLAIAQPQRGSLSVGRVVHLVWHLNHATILAAIELDRAVHVAACALEQLRGDLGVGQHFSLLDGL
jgi:hypothetical protein